MRTRFTLIVLAVAALAATAFGAAGHARASTAAACDPASLNLVKSGKLTIGTDNPAYPPWYAGGTPKGSKWKINDPTTGKGFESAVAYAVAKQLGFSKQPGDVDVRPVQQVVRARPEEVRLRHQPDLLHAGAREGRHFSGSYYDVNQAIVVLKGTKIASVQHVAGPEAATSSARSSGRRATRTSSDMIKPTQQPAVYDNAGRGRGAEEQADRRPRRRPADRVLRDRRAGAELEDPRAVPDRDAAASTSAWCSRRATRCPCVEQGARDAAGERHARSDPAAVAGEGDRRAGPEVAPALAGSRQVALGGDGRRAASSIALASTVVFFALVVVAITHAPGWPEVSSTFFDWDEFRRRSPRSPRVQAEHEDLLIAEVFILVFALLLAVLRSLPGPVFFPLRALAIVYTDFFRGVPDDPRHLDPRLRRAGARSSRASRRRRRSGGSSRSSSSTRAYVAEVYRAGIESVHPSQEAAARSLGLSRCQALRYVVLPQAVRRVIPPLLNDFIGLQKDTALVGIDRRDRGVPPGPDRRGRDVQLHAVPRGGRAVRRDHDPAGAVHRLADRARPAPAAGRAVAAMSALVGRGHAQVVRPARGAARHRPRPWPSTRSCA